MKHRTKVRAGWMADKARLESEIASSVGKLFRKGRADRTAESVSEAIGIARPTYSRLESGRHMPSISFFILAVRGLGGDPAEVFKALVEEAVPAAFGSKK